MPKNNSLRELLPRYKKFSTQHLEMNSPIKKRRNVSLACTECQKRRSKVRNIVPTYDASADISAVVLWCDPMHDVRDRRTPVLVRPSS